MANLTEISIGIRKLAIIVVIVTVVYMILQFSYKGAVSYYIATHPTPTMAPDTRFGKLPKLIFSKTSTTSAGLVITLENIEGKPPIASSTAKVYSMPKKQLTISTNDRANQFASKIGFTQKGEMLNPSYYFYTDPKAPLRTLLLDIINLNCEIKYDYAKDPDIVFPVSKFISTETTVSEIKNYVNGIGIFDSSLFKESPVPQLLTYDKNSKIFNSTSNIKMANAIRLNFFREKIDDAKILPPGFSSSPNYVLYSSSDKNKVLEIGYTFWPVDLSDASVYPLKTSQDAWNELISGQGIIVQMGKNTPDSITVRKIYLAYYDSEDPQAFLQPIFVFEGDNDFAAYVPAVSPEFTD